MNSPLKPAVFALLCLGVGLSGTLGLWHLLHAPRHSAEPPVVHRVKISARAAVTAPAPVAVAPLALTAKVLPLRGKLSAPRKTLPKPAAAGSLEVSPPEQALSLPQLLPTLAQPAMPAIPAKAEARDLPVIASLEAPPMPPLEPIPSEPAALSAAVPGGNTLVLGLLLNDSGTVIDAKVLVRTNEPLSDITMVMGHMGLRWTDFSPPLQPGEQRWIERRIDFASQSEALTPLP